MQLWLFVIINGLIFISLLIASFLLVHLFIKNKVIYKSFKMIYKKIKRNESKRIKLQEKMRYEDGKQEKVKFLTRVDLLIARSNLNIIFPFINAETYLIGTFILCLFAFLIIQIFSGIVFGLIGFLCIVVISYLVLYFLSGFNYKRTEKNIMNFANLLENYSKTSDDIISIFQKVIPYTENPIRNALEECTMSALATGKISSSLYELSNKIEHEKFKELISNLEICSRYEANYAQIITESKQNLREYIAAKEKRKEMKNSCKTDMFILIIAGYIILKVVSGLGEGSIMSVLMSSFIGKLIILYCAVIFFIIIFMFVSVDK